MITGAASGIGRGLAEHCGNEGMVVVLADVNETALQNLKSELERRNVKVTAVSTDVADAAAVEKLAEAAVDAFGAVDLLFNNAGVLISGFSWEKSEQEWDWILGVNLKGVICASIVFEAIRAERFWIFPHSEFTLVYQRKTDSVLHETNPPYLIFEAWFILSY